VVLDCDVPDLASLRVERVKAPSYSEKRGHLSSGRGNKNKANWIKGYFIRGPIPLSWWGRVCRLPGKNPLIVASAIWFVAGLRNRKDDLKLTTSILEKFGLTDRSAKSRSLKVLEKKGLIRVERQSGKNPRVTILNDCNGAGQRKPD
jgi:hypothetical protein